MAMEGVDYQFLRSGDFMASDRACDLLELTTALACANSDATLSVAIKTGTARFFNDLKRKPYTTIFNQGVSGAKAFNVVLIQREIDKWIEVKKTSFTKKSGYSWGALIHGNRILAACVFKQINNETINLPIDEFRKEIIKLEVAKKCAQAYDAMVACLARLSHYG